MSAVYSRQFYADQITAGGTAPLATVPAGVVWVLRDITLGNLETTDTGAVSITVVAAGAPASVARWATIPDSAAVYWTGRQVLNAGDLLRVYNNSGLMSVLISGYELSAP